MCGICGIFDLSGDAIDRADLERMIASIQHRGPDGDGRYLDGEVGLGHRRLSIIDVAGGAQPIANEDRTLQVVFNGEIYNYIELRNELVALGHRFDTVSDTEVIVHAYEQWGPACLRRFNGMFAFALWDTRKRELFLARDHLGVKPLYYFQIGNKLVFASEVKALLTFPNCPRAVDIPALSQLFTFRYVPSPLTLFHGLSKLQPGHYMLAKRSGTEIVRFWTQLPKIRDRWKESDLIEEYQELLEDAVKLQLRSDVPLGLFLSSGVDSSALLAIMSKYCAGAAQTFTIGFDAGEKTNEVFEAAKTARRFGADHYSSMVSARDYCDYYQRYMRDLEEPVGHESAAAFYFVAKAAGQRVKVALCGQGADEPWAGYHRHWGVKLSAAYSRLPTSVTQGFKLLLDRVPGRMERLTRGVTSLGEKDVLTRLTKVYSFFSADMKASLYKGELRQELQPDPYGTREALRRLQADVQHLDPLSQALYIDTRASLPDDLLMVGDKTSMANSLEVRVPFLDYRLVEFAESLPSKLKLSGRTGKYLHKKAMLKWLPAEIVYRKKLGFSSPIGHWLRTSMRPVVDECLLSRDSGIARYFDQRRIATLLDQDRRGLAQYTRHIYLLLSFELWHREFMRG